MADAQIVQAIREEVAPLKGVLQDVRAYAIDIKTLLTAGAVTVQNFPAGVNVNNFPTTQPVSGTVSVDNFPGALSLGVSTGKTNVTLTGSLTTTATTANQVVLTYTVTVGQTLYLEYLAVIARLTTPSATASILGAWSMEVAGVKRFTWTCTNPTTSHLTPFQIVFPEPLSIPAATVVRVVTTPAANTSMLWMANFGGYEK